MRVSSRPIGMITWSDSPGHRAPGPRRRARRHPAERGVALTSYHVSARSVNAARRAWAGAGRLAPADAAFAPERGGVGGRWEWRATLGWERRCASDGATVLRMEVEAGRRYFVRQAIQRWPMTLLKVQTAKLVPTDEPSARSRLGRLLRIATVPPAGRAEGGAIGVRRRAGRSSGGAADGV